jgi:hypothetical protein
VKEKMTPVLVEERKKVERVCARGGGESERYGRDDRAIGRGGPKHSYMMHAMCVREK